MLEEQFVKEVQARGYVVDCPDGEHLVVRKNDEEVARVNAFHPQKMNTLNTPDEIIEIVIAFSATKHNDRFVSNGSIQLPPFKVTHKCRHGHIFYPLMIVDEKGKLQYAEYNSNLCTANNCDSVGWIADTLQYEE